MSKRIVGLRCAKPSARHPHLYPLPGERKNNQRRKPMRRRIISVVLATILLATIFTAEAQQPAKIPKIGLSQPVPLQLSQDSSRLRRELRELGYVEGKNIAFEYRHAENKLDRLPALADELVRLKVDVLVASQTVTPWLPRTLPGRSPSFFRVWLILLRLGWLTAWRGLGATSPGSPTFRRCWPASDWSYSRKPFPSSPALRCCGIHGIQTLPQWKESQLRHENWVCNFIPWR